MKDHISLRTRLRSHMVSPKQEEFPEKDRAVEGILLEEEEEEEKEK
jgi:hypothetical protein